MKRHLNIFSTIGREMSNDSSSKEYVDYFSVNIHNSFLTITTLINNHYNAGIEQPSSVRKLI
jgi:hypothetical protein